MYLTSHKTILSALISRGFCTNRPGCSLVILHMTH